MKRVVSPLFFFLLFLTLSTAEILDHDHNHNHDDKTSSDGQDSSKILLPTESSPVPDHTESSSSSLPVEEKEERQDVEITPDGLTRITKIEFDLMYRNPAHLRTRVYPYSFRVFRFNPRCRRDLQRFFRYHPRVNEEGSSPVLSNVLRHRHVARNSPEGQESGGGDELQVFDLTSGGSLRPRHHHHDHDDHEEKDEAVQKFDFFSGSHSRPRHHHHHHDDEHEHDGDDDHMLKEEDQTVEMKTEVQEDDHGEEKKEPKETEIKRDALKTIRKFLGY